MKVIPIVLVLFFVFGFTSCKKSEVDAAKKITISDTDINQWIYSKIKENYFWEDKMVEQSRTDLSLSPSDYFYSILYDYKVTDRFSWIQENAEELKNSLDGVTSTFGLNYAPYYTDNQKNNIAFSVTYVLKQSVAERVGLKRGDLITKVNGQDINIDNYKTILSPETVTLNLGNYINGNIVTNDKTVEITKEITKNNALYYHRILTLGGKKIGYFVYNQFLTDYDKELNNLFGEFKSAGIDELIVDFRYNPGGYISSAELLSSLIVKNLNEQNLMTRQIWNALKTKEFKEKEGPDVFNTYFFKSRDGIGPLNNLTSINKVYFLVSNSTASASELVINNLKPYMNVILVGAHTYGKNVGSITIDDDEDPPRWAWGMQPIVLKSENANGESDYGTPNGFSPDILKNDNILPFKDFGDPEETLLYAALSDILSESTLAKAKIKTRVSAVSTFTPVEKESLSDNKFRNRKEMWISEFPHKK